MMLNLPFLLANAEQILQVVALVAVGKAILIAVATHLLGFRHFTALMVGLGLFQVGELSLIMAQVGLSSSVLDDRLYSLVTVMVSLTMIATPFLLRAAMPLFLRARGGLVL